MKSFVIRLLTHPNINKKPIHTVNTPSFHPHVLKKTHMVRFRGRGGGRLLRRSRFCQQQPGGQQGLWCNGKQLTKYPLFPYTTLFRSPTSRIFINVKPNRELSFVRSEPESPYLDEVVRYTASNPPKHQQKTHPHRQHAKLPSPRLEENTHGKVPGAGWG